MTKKHLTGLSHKGDEIRRQQLERIELLEPRVFKAPKKSLVDPKTFVAPVQEYQATAVNRTAITAAGAYRTGDGDVLAQHRPGAEDHLKYKSLTSTGTAIYNDRGHQ